MFSLHPSSQRANRVGRGDIRKFKKWQDGEYVVTSLETSTMRLAINGVFGEHEACARVWIDHRDQRVSVGSGFTAEDRVRYARDPKLIVSRVPQIRRRTTDGGCRGLRWGRRSRYNTSRSRGL